MHPMKKAWLHPQDRTVMSFEAGTFQSVNFKGHIAKRVPNDSQHALLDSGYLEADGFNPLRFTMITARKAHGDNGQTIPLKEAASLVWNFLP